MKLERKVYPDFYAERENIIKENILDLFTGRKESLKKFRDGLAFHATGNHPDNLAIIAQRKAGKTALLARLREVLKGLKNLPEQSKLFIILIKIVQCYNVRI